MEHPVFRNNTFLFLYVLSWTVVSVSMAIAVFSLSLMPFDQCFFWGFSSGFVFAALTIPLWSILKYTDYSSQKSWQAMLSYVVLGFVLITVWLLAVYLLVSSVYPACTYNAFLHLLPLLCLLGSCFFLITVLIYIRLIDRLKKEEHDTALEIVENEFSAEAQVSSEEWIERIAIKTKQKIDVVIISDIIFIQSEGDYALIHTASGRFLKEQTMKFFETHLPPSQFVRIHRSHIVNVSCISKIQLFEKQSYLIILKNGVQLKASISGYKLLKGVLNL